MGDSDKPDIGCTLAEHASYLDDLIAAHRLKDITLVVLNRDFALGMRSARLNEKNVQSLAVIEVAIPLALPAPILEAIGPQDAQLFSLLRSGQGEKSVLENNFFVEFLLEEFVFLKLLSYALMGH